MSTRGRQDVASISAASATSISSSTSSGSCGEVLGARFDATGSKSAARREQSHRFKVGDRVLVRDKEGQPWAEGTVELVQADGRPRVRREGSAGSFPYSEVKTKNDAEDDE